MSMPPYAVSVHIADRERTKFRLWFPLFILWPLILVLLVLTLIATLFADLYSLVTGRRPGYTRFLFGILGVVGRTRGTEVSINDRNHHYRTVAFTLR